MLYKIGRMRAWNRHVAVGPFRLILVAVACPTFTGAAFRLHKRAISFTGFGWLLVAERAS